MDIPEKVKERLKELPDKPGCYIMRDRRGKIIYVGKAVSIRKRVQSYFRKATLRRSDPKLRGLVKSICDIEFLIARNEAEALLIEGRLIKDYKPRYNISFKDDKRFIMLRSDATAPLPLLKLCRIRRDDGALYFGPYASSPAARATLDFVEKKFGLRKCTPRRPDSETHKHCMNDIIRFCSAPCIGKISDAEYRVRFNEACEFLKGKKPQYLRELKELMEEAAEKLQFEKAAALRDTYFLLHKVIKQNARTEPTMEMKALELSSGLDQMARTLALAHQPDLIECYDISNISGTFAVGSMVCFIKGRPAGNRYRRFKIKTVQGSNDPEMMAEVIRRRFTALNRETDRIPDLVILDGGITQLNAAKRELTALGLEDIACIGLAKRYEEIYIPDRKIPLRLPGDSPALKILQRLRDEAHRFALAYHHKLRNRRIRESVIDEIPGVGPERKKILLQHFGSAHRLMKASAEQIAGVPGIGPATAQLIYSHLH